MNRKIQYYLLLPMSILYGVITAMRNLLYDFRILKSTTFDIPIISIGNLAVGGTGKTPHVEFLIKNLQNTYKIAFLSRGYKRKTSGFVLAGENTNAVQIGDEPFQVYRKFNNIPVAVDEKRVRGARNIKKLLPETQIIVLDDAFQHRAVKPQINILLTEYSKLYTDDCMLPAGKLREYSTSSKRADIIVVTKCNPLLSFNDQEKIIQKLKPLAHQHVFFSYISYQNIQPVFNNSLPVSILTGYKILLVTGIVNFKPLENELIRQKNEVTSMSFPDHHNFSVENYRTIEKSFLHLQSNKKIVVFTEKDASRIINDRLFPENIKQHCYFIPIQVQFIDDKNQTFIKLITSHVNTYTRNC